MPNSNKQTLMAGNTTSSSVACVSTTNKKERRGSKRSASPSPIVKGSVGGSTSITKADAAKTMTPEVVSPPLVSKKRPLTPGIPDQYDDAEESDLGANSEASPLITRNQSKTNIVQDNEVLKKGETVVSNSNATSTPVATIPATPKATMKRTCTPTAVNDEAPMFLRKAFHMVNACDPDIASWSEDGTYFHVKDADRFAKEVIPKCFKHSKFSSFVRQLNFYGFRKIQEEPIELQNHDKSRANWSHFRHPHFQRDRPDLLVNITRVQNKRKNAQNEVTEEEPELEYMPKDALINEVKDLRAQVQSMKHDIDVLAALVYDLSDKQHQLKNANSLRKKRRLEPAEPVTLDPFKIERFDRKRHLNSALL